MQELIINRNGSINLREWLKDGVIYRIVKTKSTGRGVLDAISTVFGDDDSRYEIPHRKLTGRKAERI